MKTTATQYNNTHGLGFICHILKSHRKAFRRIDKESPHFTDIEMVIRLSGDFTIETGNIY